VLHTSDILASQIGTNVNLIGFDPRGVNNSGPSLDCFPNDPAAALDLSKRFIRPINSKSHDSIVSEFEMAGAFGNWCSRVHRNSSAKYANTVATAMDMLNYVTKKAIVEGKDPKQAKLWYWGVSYGSVLGTVSEPAAGVNILLQDDASATSVATCKTCNKMLTLSLFSRFSIQLILTLASGLKTAAALYPDRIGRLIIDAVVDVSDAPDTSHKFCFNACTS